MFRGAPLSGRCMSQFFMRPPFRAVFTESEKIAITDEWPDFVRNPPLGIRSLDSVKRDGGEGKNSYPSYQTNNR